MSSKKSTPPRTGISLLEAILALAILGMALAALSTIVATGTDAGLEAEDLIHCRMAAIAAMDETLIDLDSGITPVTTLAVAAESFASTHRRPIEIDTRVQPGTLSGLLQLRITARSDHAEFSLDRWVIDPQFYEPESVESL